MSEPDLPNARTAYDAVAALYADLSLPEAVVEVFSIGFDWEWRRQQNGSRV